MVLDHNVTAVFRICAVAVLDVCVWPLIAWPLEDQVCGAGFKVEDEYACALFINVAGSGYALAVG